VIVLIILFSDFKSAWLGLANCNEQYILRYESKYLREMGQVLDYLVSVGVTTAVQETLKHTVLSGTCFAMVLLQLPELKHYCLRHNEGQ